MAARATPLFDVTPAPEPIAAPRPGRTLTHLARLHDEAVETARLANLLGRSLHATGALAALAVIAIVASAATAAPAIAWAALVGLACAAMLRSYRHAIGQPFERAALQCFASDLHAGLLYAGFAWGAGAFLVLPEPTAAIAVVLFAAAPCVAIAVLLRERRAAVLFVAPTAALASLACLLRPVSGGAAAAGFILLVCAATAFALQWASRARSAADTIALPRSLIAS